MHKNNGKNNSETYHRGFCFTKIDGEIQEKYDFKSRNAL